MKAQPVCVRALQPGEEAACAGLVREVFHRFVAPEFSDQGIASFEAEVAPEGLVAVPGKLVLVAERAGELVGVIRMHTRGHISLLFVREDCQRLGIARALLDAAVVRLHEVRPGMTKVTVNSSRYAVEVYRRLGFDVIGPETEQKGILSTPMVLELTA